MGWGALRAHQPLPMASEGGILWHQDNVWMGATEIVTTLVLLHLATMANASAAEEYFS
jgi:hypothetical protein